jgi:hypothetical protein
VWLPLSFEQGQRIFESFIQKGTPRRLLDGSECFELISKAGTVTGGRPAPKYVRRVMGANGKYRYFYGVGVAGQKGHVLNREHWEKAGTRLAFNGGHLHIHGKNKKTGKLIVSHTDDNIPVEMSHDELHEKLAAYHAHGIAEAHGKAKAGADKQLAAAKKYGTDKHVDAAQKRADKFATPEDNAKNLREAMVKQVAARVGEKQAQRGEKRTAKIGETDPTFSRDAAHQKQRLADKQAEIDKQNEKGEPDGDPDFSGGAPPIRIRHDIKGDPGIKRTEWEGYHGSPGKMTIHHKNGSVTSYDKTHKEDYHQIADGLHHGSSTKTLANKKGSLGTKTQVKEADEDVPASMPEPGDPKTPVKAPEPEDRKAVDAAARDARVGKMMPDDLHKMLREREDRTRASMHLLKKEKPRSNKHREEIAKKLEAHDKTLSAIDVSRGIVGQADDEARIKDLMLHASEGAALTSKPGKVYNPKPASDEQRAHVAALKAESAKPSQPKVSPENVERAAHHRERAAHHAKVAASSDGERMDLHQRAAADHTKAADEMERPDLSDEHKTSRSVLTDRWTGNIDKRLEKKPGGTSNIVSPANRMRPAPEEPPEPKVRPKAEITKIQAPSATAPEPAKPTTPAATHDDLIKHAKETYGLSDAEAEKVRKRSDRLGTDKHIAEGRHDDAKAAVRSAVKEHLSLSQDRGMSPSKAESYLSRHEGSTTKKGIKSITKAMTDDEKACQLAREAHEHMLQHGQTYRSHADAAGVLTKAGSPVSETFRRTLSEIDKMDVAQRPQRIASELAKLPTHDMPRDDDRYRMQSALHARTLKSRQEQIFSEAQAFAARVPPEQRPVYEAERRRLAGA